MDLPPFFTNFRLPSVKCNPGISGAFVQEGELEFARLLGGLAASGFVVREGFFRISRIITASSTFPSRVSSC